MFVSNINLKHMKKNTRECFFFILQAVQGFKTEVFFNVILKEINRVVDFETT